MDRNKLIVRAIIIGFALLAIVEGWSLATAPRPHPPAPAENAVQNAATP